MKPTHATALLFLSGCIAALGAPQAFAQTAPASQLEEVVVTATRRQERLQDVPIAVTALTSKGLEQKQVVNVMALGKLVPGMQIKPTQNELEITTAIRGVTQLIPSINTDPPIGNYVDGVYTAIDAGSNLAMIDIERVEVLKGPQGTLFGRNTIGGAISITTAKPKDVFGGSIEGDAGNYGAYGGTAILNLPLVPGLLDTRFVYQHAQHGGYGRDFTTNTPTATLDENYFRGSVKFTPSSNWETLVSGYYTKADGHAAASKLGYFDTSGPFNAVYPAVSGNPGDLLSNYVNKGGFQDTYSDLDSQFHLKQYGVTATETGHLNDLVSVKSITGYTHTQFDTISDLDATPYVYLNLNHFPINADQLSEELQIYGNAFDNRLKWIAGAYAFSEKGSQISEAQVLSAFAPPADQATNPQGPNVDNKSYSVFAQLTYQLASTLRLTGGVRLVKDDRRATYHDHSQLLSGGYAGCNLANVPLGDMNPGDCTFSDSVSYTYAPWTVGLDYKPDDNTLIYAKISQGYRSGAFGLTGPARQAAGAGGVAPTQAEADAQTATNLAEFGAVAPEKLLSPEIGGKFDFFDHRLRVNVAGYYSDYNNIQLTVNLAPACATCTPNAVLENSGTAHIWGAEVETSAKLGKLQLDGDLGYTDPKYVKGAIGQPVVNVSKLSAAITGNYPFETSMGVLNLTGAYSYRSSATFYSTSGLPANEQAGVSGAVSQKGFGMLDARAAFTLASQPVTFALFVLNLTDVKYITSGTDFPPPLGYAINWPGAPRTFGGSIKYEF